MVERTIRRLAPVEQIYKIVELNLPEDCPDEDRIIIVTEIKDVLNKKDKSGNPLEIHRSKEDPLIYCNGFYPFRRKLFFACQNCPLWTK